jgi:hypothetical protein
MELYSVSYDASLILMVMMLSLDVEDFKRGVQCIVMTTGLGQPAQGSSWRLGG